MIRIAVRLLFLFGLLVVIAPFLISSLWTDERGITIPGHVYSKDERINVHYSSWKRLLQITVEYDPPQEYGVRYLTADVTPERFDQLKKGDLVQLRYLRKEDTPQLPGANVLRQMSMLPTVRLADQRTWSWFEELFEGLRTVITGVLLVLLVLYLWRVARLPGFVWAVSVCFVVAIGAAEISDFPKPMPAPQSDVRQASGVVKRLRRIDKLFRHNHQRGLPAPQPIDIVGIEFVPAGRTEPVVAVDLIDAGSVANLSEHAAVAIDYENGTPRTAWIHGATRQFPSRNLRALVVQLITMAAITVLLLPLTRLFGKWYRRLGSPRN